METPSLLIEVAGYGLTLVAFILLTLLLLSSVPRKTPGLALDAAVVTTAAWGGVMLWGAIGPGLTPFQVFLAEMTFDAVWLLFLAMLVSGAVSDSKFRAVRLIGGSLGFLILFVGVGYEFAYRAGMVEQGAISILVMGSVLTSLVALVGIEQIFRNAREAQRSGIKFLCIALTTVFLYDLLLYSNAILAGEVNPHFWIARGYVVALCAPLIAIAARRSPDWATGVFVSRQVVFYTTTMMAAGIYLTVIGFAGSYIRTYGDAWGEVAQVVVFAAAAIVLFVLLFSDRVRRQLRVFISKHFYENKYDYREEWLRLIDTLTDGSEGLPLRKRAIKSLTQILEAPSGVLWLADVSRSDYRVVAAWDAAVPDASMQASDSLPTFLQSTGWVVDTREYVRDPGRYELLELDSSRLGINDPNVVVPLVHESQLIGFVVTSQPETPASLNYEDRDLLKTAGKQIASYLALQASADQLSQGRQFEAFNKLTAYLMHDLKNVIAQQSLLVENAERHKGNPEFIDDAIETISSGVKRMRRVIDQLRQNSVEQNYERVELGAVVMRAVSQCDGHNPAPIAEIGEKRVWTRADPERLQMAIYHTIRNAQDATPDDGAIRVTVQESAETCDIIVSDDGHGMDEVFLRERLFKPFDSTKGKNGMGIGVYETREFIRSLGGEVEVISRPGEGSTFRLRIPISSETENSVKSADKKINGTVDEHRFKEIAGR